MKHTLLTMVILSVVLSNVAHASILCTNTQVFLTETGSDSLLARTITTLTHINGEVGILEVSQQSEQTKKGVRDYFVLRTIGTPQEGHYWIDPAPTQYCQHTV